MLLRRRIDHLGDMLTGWKEEALNLSIAVELRDQTIAEKDREIEQLKKRLNCEEERGTDTETRETVRRDSKRVRRTG
jgi:hypothetical protein